MAGIDDVLQRYKDYSSQVQAPLPPPGLATQAGAVGIPQYVIPNAFQTPRASISMYKPMSSQNEYEAQVSSRFAGQMAMYSDPSAGAGNVAARTGRRIGGEYGGYIGGAAAGLATGVNPVGGGIGGVLGDAFGGGIGAAVGRPLGFMSDLVQGNVFARERQAQHMHMTTGLQQSTAGHLMLGQGEAGLGGRGMNMQSASKLASKLTTLGSQENVSRDDMTSLTRAAGEMNFLDQATNTDQIFDTVKKLTKLVSMMGKITGDPTIQNNLREIANLRGAGMNLDQAVQATAQIDMSSRAMGMNRFQAMSSAGAVGMGMFQQGGLTGGAGLVQGVGAGAMARMGAAGLDSRQLALAGGQAGLTQSFTQQSLQFARGPGNMMMLSGLEQGDDGQFGLQKDFGKSLMERGDFAGRLQKGVGNVKSPGQLIQFLGQQRELQSEMMEQLGPFGAQIAQGKQIEDLAGMMGGANKREDMLMAASMVTGSAEKGQQLVRTLGSQQFRDRSGAFFDEEIKRTRFGGAIDAGKERGAREDRLSQRKRRSFLGRGHRGGMTEWLGEVVGFLDDTKESMGSVEEIDEAVNREQVAQDKIADEQFEAATGLERTTHRAKKSSLARPVERERKRVEKMVAAGWKIANLSRSGKELGVGVEFEYDEETKTVQIKPGKRHEFKSTLFGGTELIESDSLTGAETAAADLFMGEDALTSGFSGGVLELATTAGSFLGIGGADIGKEAIQTQRRQALSKLTKTGKRVQEMKKVTQKQWHTALKQMKKLGPEMVASMNRAAVDYAKSLGGEKGVDADAIYRSQVKAIAKVKNLTYAEADAMLSPQREQIVRTAMKFIETSGDPVAKDALSRSADAAGIVNLQGMDEKRLESTRDQLDKEMLDTARELGFADRDAEDMSDMSGEQREAFDTFRGLTSEDQALAMGVVAMGSGTASEGVEEELAAIRMDDPKRYDRAVKAAEKMRGALGKDESKRLGLKAGRTTEMYGGLDDYAEMMEEGTKGRGMARGKKSAISLGLVEAEKRRRGIDSDVSYSGEGVSGGTEESRKKEEELRSKKDQLGDLSATFGEFPGAVNDLKTAAKHLERAVGEMDRTYIPKPGE